MKELGDGLMVWCPTPADGFDVAVAMRFAVERARRHDGFPLAIRMGLHHGEVLPRDDDVVGLTVNVAARIAALAGPGELLVSEAVVEGFGPRSGAALEPVDPVQVKGVRDPVWLARVGATG